MPLGGSHRKVALSRCQSLPITLPEVVTTDGVLEFANELTANQPSGISGCSAVLSAPALGAGGRRLKSDHPDHLDYSSCVVTISYEYTV